MASCSLNRNSASEPEQTTVTSKLSGTVALFTPADGITLNQQTPLNKWAKLGPDITQALTDHGFAKDDITTKSSSSLEKQSQAIQDYVVDHLSSKGEVNASGISIKPSNMTILVAPAAKVDAVTRQYGDYVSQELNVSKEGDEEQRDALDRLISSLNLAKESGMHVVLLGNSIAGYKPDAYVSFSDGFAIGRLQAQKIVTKLELSKASKDNPKRIEVLLPYIPSDDDSDDATFAQNAFRGIWQVLGPYYQSGAAISPSGALTASTTEEDWESVAYNATKEETVSQVLTERLAGGTDDATTRIDAVLAMNDSAASEVVQQLSDLGYTGSAADINPQITISDIVDNIAGKKDLNRQTVPDPVKAPENDDHQESSVQSHDTAEGDHNGDAGTTDKAKASQWPLVTGYGSYLNNIPDVVNGKQWMTGMENRLAIAEDLAKVCSKLNTGQTIGGMSSVKITKVGGVSDVPTIEEPLMAVSASNLKAALIDPGYITLADAGL